jgi:hypothetical protein
MRNIYKWDSLHNNNSERDKIDTTVSACIISYKYLNRHFNFNSNFYRFNVKF